MKQVIDKIDEVHSWPERKRMLAAIATMIAASGVITAVWFSTIFPNRQLTELNLASASQPFAPPTNESEGMNIPGPAAGLMESFQGIGNLLRKEADGAQDSYSFLYGIPLRVQRTLQYITDAARNAFAPYIPIATNMIIYYEDRLHNFIQQTFGN